MGLAQQDHSLQRGAEEKARRQKAQAQLKETLRDTLSNPAQGGIEAAKNTSWLSRTGEYHAERDRLAEIMAAKVANNNAIPTSYIENHQDEIIATTKKVIDEEKMKGTAEEAGLEDKTYRKITKEFLEHPAYQSHPERIEEVLVQRDNDQSFDHKIAEAAAAKVEEKAKEQKTQTRQTSRTR